MSYIASEEAYLMHHGVKGMKWGVRRARQGISGRMRSTVGAYANTRKQRAQIGRNLLTKNAKSGLGMMAGSAAYVYGKSKENSVVAKAGLGLMVASGAKYMTDSTIASYKANKLVKNEYNRLEGKRKVNELIQMQTNKERNRANQSQQSKKSFKQRMIDKHGSADDDVEGDPSNYSWYKTKKSKTSKPGSNVSASRKALMGVGGALMHVPGMKTAVNIGYKRAGLNYQYTDKKKKR